jgi:glycosyltransferase involved in cell wall biosynthesis
MKTPAEILISSAPKAPLSETVNGDEIEVSVVMPCLNEADTLESCLAKAQRALHEGGIRGEIIVADNGSTDGSQEIVQRMGARLVPVKARGYGNALMGGITAARGKYVIMGDADDSYDFREVPKFVEKLREGYDLVQGCRLPVGGGRIMSGAMPFLHRWWGNPMFSMMARTWFHAPIHDVYCGLRGFTKAHYENLRQQCVGMEFATEMIVKSSLFKTRMSEVPITLYVDGRKAHAPHLKTFRDGWRTLRFFMMYSPRWLFFLPGVALMIFGLLGFGMALPGVRIGPAHLGAHTLLFASLFILCGYQTVLFALFSKTFAVSQGLQPQDPHLSSFFRIINLERGLVMAAAAFLAGFLLLGLAVFRWWQSGFGDLDYAKTMRWVIPGATLVALSCQTFFSSFFVSILGMYRK